MIRHKLKPIKRNKVYIKVLICGGTNLTDYHYVAQRLDDVHSTKGVSCIIYNDVTGAGAMSAVWAFNNKVKSSIKDVKPDLALVFPGGDYVNMECQILRINKGSTECIAKLLK